MPSLYICLERDLPHFQSGIGEGRALSAHEPQLTAVAHSLSVTPLMNFFSVNPEEAAAMLEDDSGDLPDLPGETWFPASEGLATVESLLKYLNAENSAVSDSLRLIKELNQFRDVLLEADREKVGWHLAIDF